MEAVPIQHKVEMVVGILRQINHVPNAEIDIQPSRLRLISRPLHRRRRDVHPAGLEALGRNLFHETSASGQATTSTPDSNGLGRINQGFIENSNVNVVEELVNMISAQRAYETNSKVITAADHMLGTINQAVS